MTDLHTDGNEIAGLLAEFLAVDPTTTVRRCQSCHAEGPLAAHLTYRGAGIVLRCPHCADVAIRVAESADGLLVECRGVFRVGRVG